MFSAAGWINEPDHIRLNMIRQMTGQNNWKLRMSPTMAAGASGIVHNRIWNAEMLETGLAMPWQCRSWQKMY